MKLSEFVDEELKIAFNAINEAKKSPCAAEVNLIIRLDRVPPNLDSFEEPYKKFIRACTYLLLKKSIFHEGPITELNDLKKILANDEQIGFLPMAELNPLFNTICDSAIATHLLQDYSQGIVGRLKEQIEDMKGKKVICGKGGLLDRFVRPYIALYILCIILFASDLFTEEKKKTKYAKLFNETIRIYTKCIEKEL